MVETITATYKHDNDDWTITVSDRGKELTGKAPGIIAARDRADQLVEKLAPNERPTVVHLLNGNALEFTSAYMAARLTLPEIEPLEIPPSGGGKAAKEAAAASGSAGSAGSPGSDKGEAPGRCFGCRQGREARAAAEQAAPEGGRRPQARGDEPPRCDSGRVGHASGRTRLSRTVCARVFAGRSVCLRF